MKNAIKMLTRASLVLAGLVLLPSCGGDEQFEEPIQLVIPRDTDAGAATRPQVTFTISNGAGISGTMVITLVPEYAPKTVANFLAYVASGFYVNTIIHRYEANFVMQGGGYETPVATTQTPVHKTVGAPVDLEIKVSNVLGTVAMARTSALNSATSEFFINLKDNSFLDTSAGGYAAFGYISDLTLVNTMKTAPCLSSVVTSGTALGCLPVPNLVITAAAKTR
jgi:cyclophilin family peptidyl-prolyl cis-trans isomerase